ncbi:MAG TPA: hypothetical protein VHT28_04785, partial [Silvibacterium sp.]|nr:hypothetical protein [Silvibacterium sp.]
RAASRSLSPLLLLQATLRIATKGIAGAAIFVVAMMGYSLGGGLILTALLKPFLPPALTGLWIGPHVFAFGIGAYAADHTGVHEVLGVWYIPIALAFGGVILHVTTLAIRKLLRVFARARNVNNAYWSSNAGVSV